MTPKQLLDAYNRGENITELLRRLEGSDTNNEEIIEIAYDLQAGSYTKAIEDPKIEQHKDRYAAILADHIGSLTNVSSILEPGVGEGTTLSFVLKHLESDSIIKHGFDISWSRISCCQQWLDSQGIDNAFLSVASILNTPYKDNSFDVVYTSHTIEPNGGNETPILSELFRITSRFLILLEPGYELADEPARNRMTRLGYCRGLVEKAEKLDMKVVKHELFPESANPLNPTAITVIEKNPGAPDRVPQLACPRYRSDLSHYDNIGDSYYSSESMRVYPVIQNIPCLRIEDGIIASRYLRGITE